jgi:uncharacterized membrane protein YbaN (DUF454 family)
MKLLWNTLGLFALLLAGAGVLLPLLPTTPFLLLASACFVQGSPRLHHWLHSNRVLGGYIRDFKEKRGIPLRSKIVALVALWASILFSAYRVRFVSLKLLLIAIAVGVSIYLLSQKTRTADGD